MSSMSSEMSSECPLSKRKVATRTVAKSTLSYLMKCPSKSLVESILNHAFVQRRSKVLFGLEDYARQLDLTPLQIEKMFQGIQELIQKVVGNNLHQVESIQTAIRFIETVDSRLENLLAEIIGNNLFLWREAAIRQKPSLPLLLGIQWRVDLQVCSKDIQKISVPVGMIRLKTQNQQTNKNSLPGNRHIHFEVTQDTLDVLIEGLWRIRDQLNTTLMKENTSQS